MGPTSNVYQKAMCTKKQSVPKSNVYQKARGTKKQCVPKSKRNQKARGTKKQCVPKSKRNQKAKCTRKQCVPKSKRNQKAKCTRKQCVPKSKVEPKRGCSTCTLHVTPNRQPLTTPLRPWCVYNKKSCLNRPPPARCNATYARPTTTFWFHFPSTQPLFGSTFWFHFLVPLSVHTTTFWFHFLVPLFGSTFWKHFPSSPSPERSCTKPRWALIGQVGRYGALMGPWATWAHKHPFGSMGPYGSLWAHGQHGPI
jgi:hypothetical protein